MVSKIINIFSVLLALNYCALPVYALKPCQPEMCYCCCENTSAIPSGCSCAFGQSNDKKQPVNSAQTTLPSFQSRFTCKLEKHYFPPSLNHLINESKPILFAGQNNHNVSSTITRLTFPLRI